MERSSVVTPLDEIPLGNPERSWKISGKFVVFGMVVLGSIATLVMYIYWDLHTKPFRPLTEAIGRTYKNSLPKVEGGRHKRGPMTLRVGLRVPFEPEEGDPATEEVLTKIRELIRTHQNLDEFETVQIHFFQMVPQERVKSHRFEFQPKDI